MCRCTGAYDLDPKTNPGSSNGWALIVPSIPAPSSSAEKICLVARVEGFRSQIVLCRSRQAATASTGSPSGTIPSSSPRQKSPTSTSTICDSSSTKTAGIYGTFCTSAKTPGLRAPIRRRGLPACGIVRTKDLRHGRLPDLKERFVSAADVVVHPEFVSRQICLYTRPQDDFIKAGSGGGIAWALTSDSNRRGNP